MDSIIHYLANPTLNTTTPQHQPTQIVAALGSGATLVEDPTPVTFVGVYDGHCGALAAEMAAAELHRFLEPHTELLGGAAGAGAEERVARATALMKEAYARTEAMLLARLRREGNRQDGAAAVTAAVAGRHLYVANVGDCRCVLVRACRAWVGLDHCGSTAILTHPNHTYMPILTTTITGHANGRQRHSRHAALHRPQAEPAGGEAAGAARGRERGL